MMRLAFSSVILNLSMWGLPHRNIPDLCATNVLCNHISHVSIWEHASLAQKKLFYVYCLLWILSQGKL